MVLGSVADDACTALQQAVEASRGLLVAVWLQSCGAAETLDAAIEALGAAAQATWPRWFVGRDEPTPDASIEACSKRASRIPGVSQQWLRAAWASVEERRPWRVLPFAAAVQAHQLGLALDPDRLVLALVAEQPEEEDLLGLVRAAEWLAAETSAVSVLALPESLAGNAALDAAAYDRFVLRNVESATPAGPAGADLASGSVPTARKTSQSRQSRAAPDTPPAKRHSQRVSIGPIIGVPHPLSPGEQALAAMLANDDELAGLFEHNVWVETTKGSRLVVDLLWRGGRLVVEIDGFRYHAGRLAYSSDRQRDFELLLTDYRVVRLPHDEVVADTPGMLERIRDVVRFIRSEGEGAT